MADQPTHRTVTNSSSHAAAGLVVPLPSGTELADSALEAALDYARRGWAVLPLFSPGEAGRCSCGARKCSSSGKHPHTRKGLLDASTDSAEIRDWWSRWPTANVGIRTGGVSGLVVIDVDPAHGGDDSLAELEAQHGPLPSTVQQRTGGGGRHYFLQHLDTRVRTRAGVRPGLDVRGRHGYVVAPPSRHASGERYKWLEGHGPGEIPLAPVPGWLLDLIESTERPAPTGGNGTAPERIPVGQRHDRLFRLACHLRQAGAGRESIVASLLTSNGAWCEEPLPDEEVEALASDVCSRYPAGESKEPSADRSLEAVELALERLGSESTMAEVREVAGLIAPLPELEREQMAHRLHESVKSQGVRKSAVMAKIERRRPKASRDEEDEGSAPPSPEEIEAAEQLLKSPDLLTEMARTVAEIGQVGEVENGQMVFLAAVAGHTARTHEDAIHLVLKGESSSGKNALLRNVLELLPEDRVAFLTGVSEQALVYQDRDLEGVIVFQEVEGEETAQYQLRQAASEGHLERWTVQDGQSKVVRAYVRGSMFTTTTAVALHAENQTRLFDLVADDSSPTTRQVIEAVAARAAGYCPPGEECERQVAAWRVALARLERLETLIPFARHIGDRFPDQPVRARRDIKRCLCLIRACAVLHQRTRERDEMGRLLASPGDYEMTYPLIQKVLAPSMSAVTEKGLKVARIQQQLAIEPTEGRRDASGWVDRIAIQKAAEQIGAASSRTVRKWCAHFEEVGAWEGRMFDGKLQYKIVRDVATAPLNLPTPAELHKFMEGQVEPDSDVEPGSDD